MAKKRQVTLRAQWIGKTFRELRQRNGMTLQEVGDYLARDVSSVSRFESGIHPPRRDDVVALMDLYGVEEEAQRAVILRMVAEVSKTGWWEKHARDVSNWVIDAVWLEDRAERMQTFCIATVPGLLQTPEYAEALIRVGTPNAAKQQVKRWVDLRVKRQQILERGRGLHLSVVLDEAALRRPVGGAAVMVDQVAHLIACAQQDNIDIRILPFSAGEHCGGAGAFTLISMPEPFPVVAHIESPAGVLFAEADGAEELANRYYRLQKSSMNLEESITFLAALERDLP